MGDPDVRSIEHQIFGTEVDEDCIQYDPIARPQLCNAAIARVRYPDVFAIESNGLRSKSNGVGPQDYAVAGSQLCDVVGKKVGYPNVPAIKRDVGWELTDGVGANQRHVADPALNNVVVVGD